MESAVAHRSNVCSVRGWPAAISTHARGATTRPANKLPIWRMSAKYRPRSPADRPGRMTTMTAGDVLWTPPADVRSTSRIGHYLDWLRSELGRDFTRAD